MRLACGVIMCLWPAMAGAQSFDCGKAQDATDRAICASARLRQLDSDVAAAYAAALKRDAARADAVRQAQRSWARGRATCLSGATLPAGGAAQAGSTQPGSAQAEQCLVATYVNRLAALGPPAASAAAPPTSATAPSTSTAAATASAARPPPSAPAIAAPSATAASPPSGATGTASAPPAAATSTVTQQSPTRPGAQTTGASPASPQAAAPFAPPRPATGLPATPAGAATLERERFPSAGQTDVLLHVAAPGRFAVRAPEPDRHGPPTRRHADRPRRPSGLARQAGRPHRRLARHRHLQAACRRCPGRHGGHDAVPRGILASRSRATRPRLPAGGDDPERSAVPAVLAGGRRRAHAHRGGGPQPRRAKTMARRPRPCGAGRDGQHRRSNAGASADRHRAVRPGATRHLSGHCLWRPEVAVDGRRRRRAAVSAHRAFHGPAGGRCVRPGRRVRQRGLQPAAGCQPCAADPATTGRGAPDRDRPRRGRGEHRRGQDQSRPCDTSGTAGQARRAAVGRAAGHAGPGVRAASPGRRRGRPQCHGRPAGPLLVWRCRTGEWRRRGAGGRHPDPVPHRRHRHARGPRGACRARRAVNRPRKSLAHPLQPARHNRAAVPRHRRRHRGGARRGTAGHAAHHHPRAGRC